MRLINVEKECDKLDDMYTLGDIGRRERDDMTTYMLEVATPVDAIPIEWIETYMQRFTLYTRWAFEGMIEEWRKKNETD